MRRRQLLNPRTHHSFQREGTYSYSVGDIVQYDSNKQRTFTEKAVHQFYVGLPQEPENDDEDGSDTPFSGRASVCGENKQELVIDINTDKYGEENTWRLERVNPSTDLVVGNPIRQRPLNTYSEDNRSETVAVCLPYGRYRFTMTDGVGDGKNGMKTPSIAIFLKFTDPYLFSYFQAYAVSMVMDTTISSSTTCK